MAVVIVSRVHMVRDIIRTTCQRRNFNVRAACSRTSDLTDLQKDDVVLLHTRRAPSEVAPEITRLRAICPEVRIMLITPESTIDAACALLNDQVQAIMPEDHPTEALIGALAVVMQGYCVSRPTDRPSVSTKTRRTPGLGKTGADSNVAAPRGIRNGAYSAAPVAPANWETAAETSPLSPRENTVLRKLREGGSNKDIAKELGICEATVKVYLRTCFQKIGVKNRTQAAVWASERLP